MKNSYFIPCKKVFTATLFFLALFIGKNGKAQNQDKAVLAYYSGSPERLDSFDARQMTHIVYCFGHLDGNRLKIGSARDTLTIQKMVAMKQKNPSLKVLLSLGGWGGCAPCSDVFATEKGRNEFAQSVKELNAFFKADGIDLDWEYPAVPGYPGHKYSPEDKPAFTELVKTLRKTLGKNQVITFAAGGFQRFLDEAVDWKEVMPQIDYVNLMSYDLVSGFSKTTGHHTALYSNPQQKESTHNAVQELIKRGVDPKKIIIGAAFYARIWENVPAENNGLYQPGTFKMAQAFRRFPENLSSTAGYQFYWDDVTKATYAYNPEKKLFATFDDKRSIALKTQYVVEKELGGIMFWELGSDSYTDGLLHTINQTLQQAKKSSH
ncbi:MAG TPA: glycoside hydrolase family 18 protein [Flavisolibacter sp.]|jgi:chitinase|nr:glycoside hydrolase family 18 protein [Flavisolibacter sp.]